jgi:acyl-CoA synthetase (AMP-forming)/AMP-acid ligase II
MPGTTFIQILQHQARSRPQGLAYRCGEQLWTFADVEQATNRIANALVALGVGAGDRVAALTKYHVDTLLLTLGAAKLGAVCMPVNWRLAPAEVQYIVEHGGARLMMADRAFLPLVNLPALPTIKQVVVTDGAHDELPGFRDWYAVASDQFQAVDAKPEDPMLQLYSSGTTGLPKGVVLSHAGLIFNCQLGEGVWKVDENAVVGNALPTFHIAGATMGLFPLYAGAVGASYPDFDPGAFIDAIGQHGITHTFVVPAMILFMLQSPKLKQGNFKTLKLMSYGGSPISDRVLTEAMAAFGCGFMQVYGLTEISGSATFLQPHDHQTTGPKAKLLRSAGQAVPGARVRVVDPGTLQDLPEGQTGEVLIESPGNMLGYWRNPEATAAAFPEGRNANGGWFRSGDGGYMQDGYVYINDRIKDMIISGGENIYPAEIENTLMKHPDVADGAVIGVPDEKWGESVKACVVRRPGSTTTEREIIDWMRERLAHFKCPKSIDFVDTLPRNPSGKLLKRILRAPFWEGKDRAVH